ncbi:MAG: 4'-phosphopantetheinyl transferase superfamily protein [Rhodocyclales bacterium]|nr:4'-phosphopantetheinyl transferase superfamily protein [Rhodocyclales bacterium]
MTLAGDHVADWRPVRTNELQQTCRLGPNAVHVWRFSLDDPPHPHSLLAAYLSADERARAARFVFERDRRRFESGRGLVRAVLGAYLGREPATLRFDYGTAGKPELVHDDHEHNVAFNVSHSQAWGLVGVTGLGPIGVDLEIVRNIADIDDIARQNFSSGEIEALLAMPEPDRLGAFIRCWTCKEAYVKALGAGLSTPLGGFEVSVAEGEPASLRSIEGSGDAASPWTLWGFQPQPDAWAAVAVRGRGLELFAYDLLGG